MHKLIIFFFLTLAVAADTIDSSLQNAIDNAKLQQFGSIENTSSETLVSLIAYEQSISDLSGIEQLTNLQYAWLSGNNFTDDSLIHLSKLTSLTMLDISDGGKITNADQLKNLSNLNYLKIKGQKISSLSPFLDMTSLTFLDVSENHIDLSNSQVQSDLQTLRQRGVYVQTGHQIPSSVQNLASEKQKRISTLEANPNDPKENFIYAFELLLSLLEEDDSNSLKRMAINGGAASSLINFTLPDLWRNDLDYEDNSKLNTTADLDLIEDFMVTTYIPRLTLINSHFLKMASSSSVINLTQDFTGDQNSIEVDSGDAYMIMAFTEALKAFAQVITSYEWDYNIKELEQLEEDELVSLETLLAPSDRFMKFGRLKSSNQLADARNSFKQAISYYKLGADQMKTRLGQDRLLVMNSSDLNDEQELRSDLDEFLLALDSNHNLDKSSTQDIINLNSFFSGQFDPANQLPEAVGNKFSTDILTDPTFGGLFPNWTQSIVSQKAKDANLITNDPIEGAADVKGAPNWKKTGWLGFFYAPNRQAGSNEFMMYHSLLGWSYINARSPNDIWIYYYEKDEWFWTKVSEFPSIYRSKDENWYYLNGYHSFLLWRNLNWINTSL